MILSVLRLLVALAFAGAIVEAAVAQQAQQQQQQQQQQAAPGQTEEEENPTPASLTVGSMAIAADAALGVESMAVDVSLDRVTYAYKFRNKGQSRLALAASVALPDLEVNNEGTTIYLLPSQNADNVVGLEVKANGQAVKTTSYAQAIALGIDRAADLKAENIPLIPFGEEVEKVLGSAKPQTLAKLGSLGLVTPRDPAQPDTPVIADWSLHVVHGWTQLLEPNASTDVRVAFSPIKAIYNIDATSLPGLDSLKDQVCVTPQVANAAKVMLKDKGTTASVADITLANDGPARWLENPAGTVAVRKPTRDSIVVFCGMDPATQDRDVVQGKMPGNNEVENLRVLIFARNAPPKPN